MPHKKARSLRQSSWFRGRAAPQCEAVSVDSPFAFQLLAFAAAATLLLSSCTASDDVAEDSSPIPTRGGSRESSLLRIPSRLADGSAATSVPDEIRDYLGSPVLGARIGVEDRSGICSDFGTRYEPFGSFLTGAGFSVAYVTKEQRKLASCDMLWRDGAWHRCATGVTPWQNDEALDSAGRGLSTTCRDNQVTINFIWVTSPQKARWVAIDDGNYMTVYEIEENQPVRATVVEPFEGSTDRLDSIRVLWFDAHGAFLSEETIAGSVAG